MTSSVALNLSATFRWLMYTFHRRDSGGVGTRPQTSTSWQINQSLTRSNYRPVYRTQIENVFCLHVVEPCKQWSASSFSSHWASTISMKIFFLLWSRRLFIFNGCFFILMFVRGQQWLHFLSMRCKNDLDEVVGSFLQRHWQLSSIPHHCVVLWLFNCH